MENSKFRSISSKFKEIHLIANQLQTKSMTNQKYASVPICETNITV